MPTGGTKKTTRKRKKTQTKTQTQAQAPNLPELNNIVPDKGFTDGKTWAQSVGVNFYRQGYPARWLITRAIASAIGKVPDNSFIKECLAEYYKDAGIFAYQTFALGENNVLDMLAKVFDIAKAKAV